MEMTARTALRRMGNSTGMIVPKAILVALGAQAGEPLDIGVENGRLVAARAGTLDEQVTISAAEAREMEALSHELAVAAERMRTRLDEAIAMLREANDPARDELFRQRALAELAGKPVVLDFGEAH